MGIPFTAKAEAIVLPTADLERAYSYWSSLRGGGGLPRRQDLNPASIVTLLPKLNLVDVVEDAGARRYRHRLVGTGVVNLFRGDSTGRWFDEVYDRTELERDLPAYERAAETGTPNLESVTVEIADTKRAALLSYLRLILPMTSGGKHADLLLVVFEQVGADPRYPGIAPLYRAAAAGR